MAITSLEVEISEDQEHGGMASAVLPTTKRRIMKYEYGVHATQTQSREGFIVVEAHNEEEAKVIANESDQWDWDNWSWDNHGDTGIDSVTQREAVEEDED